MVREGVRRVTGYLKPASEFCSTPLPLKPTPLGKSHKPLRKTRAVIAGILTFASFVSLGLSSVSIGLSYSNKLGLENLRLNQEKLMQEAKRRAINEDHIKKALFGMEQAIEENTRALHSLSIGLKTLREEMPPIIFAISYLSSKFLLSNKCLLR